MQVTAELARLSENCGKVLRSTLVEIGEDLFLLVLVV